MKQLNTYKIVYKYKSKKDLCFKNDFQFIKAESLKDAQEKFLALFIDAETKIIKILIVGV